MRTYLAIITLATAGIIGGGATGSDRTGDSVLTWTMGNAPQPPCSTPIPPDESEGDCGPWGGDESDGDDPNPCATVTAMPINLLTGRPFEAATDINVPIPGGNIRWGRTYDPLNPEDPWFGYGGMRWGPRSVGFPAPEWVEWLPGWDGIDPEELWFHSGPPYGVDERTRPRAVAYYLSWFPTSMARHWTWEDKGLGEGYESNPGNKAGIIFTDNGNGTFDGDEVGENPTLDTFTVTWETGQKAIFHAKGGLMEYYPNYHTSSGYTTRYVITWAPGGGGEYVPSKIEYSVYTNVHHVMDLTWASIAGGYRITNVDVYASDVTTDPDDKVAAVEYTYHDGGSTYGGSHDSFLGMRGDLIGVKTTTKTTLNEGTSTLSVERMTYYRYLTDSDYGGDGEGLLKMIFHAEASKSLDQFAEDSGATYEDAFAVPDSLADDYADYIFEYSTHAGIADPAEVLPDYWISKETVRAGCSSCGGGGAVDAGEYTFSWYDSATATGADYWDSSTEADEFKMEAKVTRPDSSIEWYLIGKSTESGGSFTTFGENQLKRKVIEEHSFTAEADQYYQTDWTFDENGRVTSLRRPDGTKLSYSYAPWTDPGDDAGYLEKVDLTKELDTVTLTTYVYGDGDDETAIDNLILTKRSSWVTGSETSDISYDYTYHFGSQFVKTVDITLPQVTEGENGDDSTTTMVRKFYNEFGALVFVKSPDGSVNYSEYEYPASAGDAKSGRLINQVADINTSSLPTGVTLPTTYPSYFDTTSGANIHTAIERDTLGRPKKITDTSGIETYLTYGFDPSALEIDNRAHRAFNTSDGTALVPALVTRFDLEGSVLDSYQMKTGTAFNRFATGYPMGDDLLDVYDHRVAWVKNIYNQAGGLTSRRVYHDTSTSGYDEVKYGYNDNGQLSRIEDGEGTITGYVRDALNRVREVYVGTDDDPSTTNMVKTASYDYGFETTPSPDEAGYLETAKAFTDASATVARQINYEYDWRGRRIGAFGESASGEKDYAEGWTYDNLGRTTENTRYSTYTIVSDVYTLTSGDMLLERQTDFDPRGRVWKEVLHTAGRELGTIGAGPGSATADDIFTYTWFNDDSQPVKRQTIGSSASRPATKWAYDSAGRVLKEYITNAGGDAAPGATDTLSDASVVTGDLVLEQTEYTYWNEGDLGTPVYPSLLKHTAHFARDHDDTSITGNLTKSNARPYYIHPYYDAAGRQTHTVNYGTGGTTEENPDYASAVPTPSDTILVTETVYDPSSGRAHRYIDADGTAMQYEFDNAGRVTYAIENEDDWDGTLASIGGPIGETDIDRVTHYGYNSNGQVATLTAYLSSTDSEVTTYTYGVTDADSPGASEIHSNTLLREIEYPDSASTDDVVRLAYDAQMGVTWMKDQRGVVREFGYDGLGRLGSDTATTVPTGVDATVRRIGHSYNDLGLVEAITSYQGTLGTSTIDSQVHYTYNGFGQVIAEYQDHGGAADTSTPKVEYAYADGSDYVGRPTSMTYPQGAVITYGYVGLNSNISRISRISDSSTTLVDYSYLGLSTPVKVNYPEPNMNLDYSRGSDASSAKYKSWDRFGRVTLQNWQHNVSGGVDAIKIGHTYNRASNRLTRDEQVALPTTVTRDELYTYDGLNRLSKVDRGTLSGSSMTDPDQTEDWTLDMLGNWDQYNFDGDGDGDYTSSADISDDRQHNISAGGAANEITQWDPFPANSGSSPVNPVYDDAGNITDDAFAYKHEYDVWNQLVKTTNQDTTPVTLGEYRYDGLGRRIEKTQSVPDDTTHEYYTEGWQRIEVRQSDDETSTTGVELFVYGLRYIDDIVLRVRDADATSIPEERRYYLTDANFNVLMLVTDGGWGVERIFYNAYGEPECFPFGDLNGDYVVDGSDSYSGLDYHILADLNLNGTLTGDSTYHSNYMTRSGGRNVLSTSHEGNTVGYTGHIWNDENTLWLARFRMFSPSLGRFLQRDPVEYSDGFNFYEYVGGNPAYSVDSYGLTKGGKQNIWPGTLPEFLKGMTRSKAIDWCKKNGCTTRDIKLLKKYFDRKIGGKFSGGKRRGHATSGTVKGVAAGTLIAGILIGDVIDSLSAITESQACKNVLNGVALGNCTLIENHGGACCTDAAQGLSSFVIYMGCEDLMAALLSHCRQCKGGGNGGGGRGPDCGKCLEEPQIDPFADPPCAWGGMGDPPDNLCESGRKFGSPPLPMLPPSMMDGPGNAEDSPMPPIPMLPPSTP